MTLTQLAALVGILFGTGCVILISQVLPAAPELGSVLDRLSPDRTLSRTTQIPTHGGDISATGRIGLWISRQAPWLMLGKVAAADLDILQLPMHRFYAMKVEYALLGFLSPTIVDLGIWLIGGTMKLPLAAGASILLALVFSIMPNQSVAQRAKKARKTFQWALIAYIELVAIERHAGQGAQPALERAASMSDSWVFRRLSEELSRSRWAGESPWEGLTRLGQQLQVEALADFAEVMRLSGEKGASVYEVLRARAASLRTQIVNQDQGDATAQTQLMSIPIGGMFLVFAIMLTVPALLRVAGI